MSVLSYIATVALEDSHENVQALYTYKYRPINTDTEKLRDS